MIVRKIEAEPVVVTAHDVAEMFTGSNEGQQAEIIIAMTSLIRLWEAPWEVQCNAIARVMTADQKQQAAAMFETLVNSLKA